MPDRPIVVFEQSRYPGVHVPVLPVLYHALAAGGKSTSEVNATPYFEFKLRWTKRFTSALPVASRWCSLPPPTFCKGCKCCSASWTALSSTS